MIQVDTMPNVDSLMDRQRLVGWVVRDSIINRGMTYSEASRRWPITLPTLNRLMNTGNVGIRFYRLAEMNLDLPRGLLELIIDGQVDQIRQLAIDEPMKTYILRELGCPPPPEIPHRRRKDDTPS